MYVLLSYSKVPTIATFTVGIFVVIYSLQLVHCLTFKNPIIEINEPSNSCLIICFLNSWPPCKVQLCVEGAVFVYTIPLNK